MDKNSLQSVEFIKTSLPFPEKFFRRYSPGVRFISNSFHKNSCWADRRKLIFHLNQWTQFKILSSNRIILLSKKSDSLQFLLKVLNVNFLLCKESLYDHLNHFSHNFSALKTNKTQTISPLGIIYCFNFPKLINSK